MNFSLKANLLILLQTPAPPSPPPLGKKANLNKPINLSRTSDEFTPGIRNNIFYLNQSMELVGLCQRLCLFLRFDDFIKNAKVT